MLESLPFDCGACGRRIKRGTLHFCLENDLVVCRACAVLRPAAHATVFPACPLRRHALLDHLVHAGDRAATGAYLGLRPADVS